MSTSRFIVLHVCTLFVVTPMFFPSHAIEVSDVTKRHALREAVVGHGSDPSSEHPDVMRPSLSRNLSAFFHASISPNPILAFKSSQFGIIRSSGVGITVSRGTTGNIRFTLTVRGITSSALARRDRTFVGALKSMRELRAYKSNRKMYDGSLGVPFLKWIGADLNKNVTAENLIRASEEQEDYDSKASTAREILQKVRIKTYQISGTKTVRGESFIPMTFFVYIKAAIIRKWDGRQLLVISSNRNDVIIATHDGVVFDSGAEQYNVTVSP